MMPINHRRCNRNWSTTKSLIVLLLIVTTTLIVNVGGFLLAEQQRRKQQLQQQQQSQRRIRWLFPDPFKRRHTTSYLVMASSSSSRQKKDHERKGNVGPTRDDDDVVVKRPASSPNTTKKSRASTTKTTKSIQEGEQRSVTSSSTSSTSLFARTPSTNDGTTTRKIKMNKYADFSKVDTTMIQDPFDVLVQESQQKLQALQDEMDPIKRRKEKEEILIAASQPPQEQMKRLEFPDLTKIDPYDPTTFGYVEIGTILGPHGVHGWTKVLGKTDFPERLTRTGMSLHLKPYRKRAPRKATIANGKMIDQDSFLVQLQGVYDRTAAQKLKGATLYYATQQDTVTKDEDEIIVSDLVGLDVYTVGSDERHDPTLVGLVQGVVLAEDLCDIPWLLHDQIEVALASRGSDSSQQQQQLGRRPPQNLVLIPLVPEIVPKIDLEQKMILIDPPSGLLDLTYVREEKVRIKGLLPPARE